MDKKFLKRMLLVVIAFMMTFVLSSCNISEEELWEIITEDPTEEAYWRTFSAIDERNDDDSDKEESKSNSSSDVTSSGENSVTKAANDIAVTQSEKSNVNATANQSGKSGSGVGAPLQVHFIDVGQGDSTLITCGGHAMMIDGGQASESNIVFTYLNKNKIKNLDYVIGSHPDADHVGGLAGAAQYLIQKCGKVAPKKVYCSATSYNSKAFKNFKSKFEELGKKIEIPKNRTKLSLGGATVTIYYPNISTNNNNNKSLIVYVQYSRRSVLFMGDAEVEEELAFTKQNPSIKADVLKVSHHGSKNATSANFLKKTKPVAAIISVGKNNSYGHPHSSTIKRLKNTGLVLYRTDMNGDIVLTISKGKASFATKKNAKNTFVAGTSASKKTPTQSSTKSSSQKKTTNVKSSTKNTSKKQNSTSDKYVLNTSSKKFHKPSCSSVKKMKDSNKAYSNNRSDIISDGYKPCKICNP